LLLCNIMVCPSSFLAIARSAFCLTAAYHETTHETRAALAMRRAGPIVVDVGQAEACHATMRNIFKMTDMTFAGLGLAGPLLKSLSHANYTTPTAIQAQTIPSLLEGLDVLGIAQTGTGKTAAFALPLLHKLFTDKTPTVSRAPRALVLPPTRRE
jgi:hypothetical protein